MKVLSVFDGISCGQIALNRAKIKYDTYYASEIDKNAIRITQKNFPKTIQLGDIEKININTLPKIDLLIGGSPCQGFSFSGKQLNFNDPRSKLFFKFAEILKTLKPIYFLLENVNMKKEYIDIISKTVGINPIKINSSLVSAQSRNRLYWTNIVQNSKICDKGILLKDIIENYISGGISNDEITNQLKQLLSTSKYRDSFRWKRDNQNRVLVMRPDGLKIQRIGRIGFGNNKSEIITVSTQPHIFDGRNIRKVSPIEAERLQTIPDNYTYMDKITDGIRYKMLGNCWTVDVIVYLLKEIDNE